VTRLRFGVTSLAVNLLLSPTVKESLKSANISQRYERISSGTFLWPTDGVDTVPVLRTFFPFTSFAKCAKSIYPNCHVLGE